MSIDANAFAYSQEIEADDMGELEFEQKYVLDPRQCDEIINAIRAPGLKLINIRQFYDEGLRYRCSTTTDAAIAQRENKKTIKLGTPYSVSLELPPEKITLQEFNKKFEKSKRRLCKMRYEFPTGDNQKVMVDFFETSEGRRIVHFKDGVYAIVAEVETILTAETKNLCLELPLPNFLEPFLLKKVDAREAASKAFKSANMTDSKENIEAIQKALAKLYESA